MSFNSFTFLFVFLPITLIIFWMLKKRNEVLSSWFLILASLVFYAVNYKQGIIIFIISLVINYIFAQQILSKNAAKSILVTGVTIDILILSLFKYGASFLPFIGNEITAPGISFYSFCEIALLFECYRGSVGDISLREFAFLNTFFPKLMEGPITTPKDILPQGLGEKSLNYEKIYRLLLLFAFGCFKKVVIAQMLKGAVDYGYGSLNAMHTGEALIIMLSYTLELYFDFSGYCDMAMAVAGFFGFELPVNFNAPYKARNIKEFWAGWHISLTKFFTNYLYIPLGGNRKGAVRTYINLIIIFFVSGLWHGNGIKFIIWGMMHGVLYAACRFVTDKTGRKRLADNRIYNIFATMLTFLYVNMAWVFFRAPSLDEAVHLFKDIGQWWLPRFNTGLAKCFNIDELWYVIKILHLDRWTYSLYILMAVLLILLLLLIFKAPTALDYSKKCKINFVNTGLIIVLLCWSLLSFEGVATYIYVNF